MKKIYLIAALAALACGVVIFAIFSKQKAENQAILEQARLEESARAAQMTDIVTAARDIYAGEYISLDMLTGMQVDRSILMSIDAVTEKESLIGRAAAKDIPAGGVITNEAVTELDGAALRLSDSIPAGLCAVQIAASMENAVAEHIEAGDYVDIVYTSTPEQTPSGAQEGQAKSTRSAEWEVLAEHLQVLRLGDRFWDGQSEYSYVILAAERKTIVSILNALEGGQIKMLLNSAEG